MGFIGLMLTKAGRRLIASAISEENPLNITHIQLGEGVCEGTFAEMKGLSKKVMEIPVKSVKRDEGKVIINCDFNSTEAPKGFYFREVGIIGNGVLCYYDNSGDDAEYIDPETQGVIKQKRLRFTLAISSDVSVTVKISSELYAMTEEVEALKKSVSDGKTNVAEAITDMGIKTESTEESPATFGTLADHIREITPVLTLTGNTAKAKVGGNEVTEQIGNPMGGEITPGASDALLIPAGTRVYASSDYIMKSLGGNAEAAHVLTGKTFSSNVAGREKAGTMTNQGAKTAALNCGGTYTIPAGYHNGSGKVTANSLGSQITTTTVYDKYKHTEKVLSTCPANMTDANCHYNGSDAIFLIGGTNHQYMLRYNIKANTWTEMAQAPKNVPKHSSIMYANEILCFYEGKVQIYNIVTGDWDTGGMTVPSSAQGACVAMVDAPVLFSSVNSNYYRYITKYNHAHNTNGGTFTTIKMDLNSTVADVMRGNACTVLMCNPGTSNNVSVFSPRSAAVYSLTTPSNNYNSYSTAKTLPGNVFGGAVVMPNAGFFLTAVQYTNGSVVWDGVDGTMTTVWQDQHFFSTSALCAVGDDVYVFGSRMSGHENKATVFHTEQYLKTHY